MAFLRRLLTGEDGGIPTSQSPEENLFAAIRKGSTSKLAKALSHAEISTFINSRHRSSRKTALFEVLEVLKDHEKNWEVDVWVFMYRNKKWVSAKIKSVNGDGTCDVIKNDGELVSRVEQSSIRTSDQSEEAEPITVEAATACLDLLCEVPSLDPAVSSEWTLPDCTNAIQLALTLRNQDTLHKLLALPGLSSCDLHSCTTLAQLEAVLAVKATGKAVRLEALDHTNRTPLGVFVESTYEERVEMCAALLAAGASTNAACTADRNMSSLAAACATSHKSIALVKLLLSAGAERSFSAIRLAGDLDYRKYAAFIKAPIPDDEADVLDEQIFITCLGDDASVVLATEQDRVDALVIAIKRSWKSADKILLALPGRTIAKTAVADACTSILKVASDKSSFDTHHLTLVLKRAADAGIDAGKAFEKVLLSWMLNYDPAIPPILQGCPTLDVNAILYADTGETALLLSVENVQHRSQELFRALVADKRTDLNCQDKEGYTPLLRLVTTKGSFNVPVIEEMVEMLLTCGRRVETDVKVKVNIGKSLGQDAFELAPTDKIASLIEAAEKRNAASSKTGIPSLGAMSNAGTSALLLALLAVLGVIAAVLYQQKLLQGLGPETA